MCLGVGQPRKEEGVSEVFGGRMVCHPPPAGVGGLLLCGVQRGRLDTVQNCLRCVLNKRVLTKGVFESSIPKETPAFV